MIDRFKDLIGISQKGGSTPAVAAPSAGSTGLGRLVPDPTADAPEAPVTPALAAPAHRTAPLAPVPPDAPDAPAAPEFEVADAFEFLFATELGDVPSASPAPPSTAAAALTEDAIDRIAAKVVQRLTDGPLRAELRRVVSEVAERLVREEIDRIRARARTD